MKYNKSSLLFLLFINFIIASCKTVEVEGDDSLIVGTKGVIGHDLFYSNYHPSPGDGGWGGGIYSVNNDGTNSAYLFRHVNLYSSPRDSMIIFTAIDSEYKRNLHTGVYLGDINGSFARRLFLIGSPAAYVILSPDASMVLCGVKGGEDYLNIYDLKTQAKHSLANPKYDLLGAALPVFSDDSKKILIAFDSLFSMNVDGSNKILIDRGAIITPYNLAYPKYSKLFDWSPDGSKVCYFSTVRGATESKAFISIKNIFTNTIDSVFDSTTVSVIQWSPKGNYIAYDAYTTEKGSFVRRIGIYNTVTQKIIHCEFPDSYKILPPSALEWSSDDHYLFASLGTEFISGFVSTLIKIDVLNGGIVQDFQIQGVQPSNLFRQKITGDH